jgi:hypothetical protein
LGGRFIDFSTGKGFSEDHNTWEKVRNLTGCAVFRDFIYSRFESLEEDVLVNKTNIKHRLKERITEAVKQRKFFTMLAIQPFDPFEFLVAQVCFLLVPRDEKFVRCLDDLVFKSVFYNLDGIQRKKHERFLEQIRKKEDIQVTIENDEDFDDPPRFKYITKNILPDEYHEETRQEIKGCDCSPCSENSKCCPQLKLEPFPYKLNAKGRSVLRLESTETIIECGDSCKCGIGCINRVSQRQKEIPLCLFKTKNRGWGVRAGVNIPKGTFILEYVGELIGQKTANARAETSYLFDLNIDKDDSQFYTIDAFKFGNLSRFVNHSCDPNAKIWFISNCQGDLKSQKLR